MNLGLRPANPKFLIQAPDMLKRDLLYFDQIHLCSLNHIGGVFELIKIISHKHLDKIEKDFELLKSKGLLCTFDLNEMINYTETEFNRLKDELDIQDKIDFLQIYKDFSQIKIPDVADFNLTNPTKRQQGILSAFDTIDKVENEVTRISSSFLNRFSAKDDAFPLLYNDNPVGAEPFHQSKVLEVVLEKLPIPNENIDWQQIIEYRSDPDSRGKFNALRTWMQDIARKDYSKKEIEERMEYLIYEYEKHLTIHKLKYNHSKLRVFVTTTLEVLENTIKLKWGEVAKTFFSLKEKKYDLLQSEMMAPGKEIAYLSNTKKAFK
ncbi:MAG: hypothetical protein WKF85_11475 [Chitinophagaceae bacterium]